MNRTKWIMGILVLLMLGSTAAVLAKYKSIQRLGEPGVKTTPIAGSKNVEVVLPERVLDFTSKKLEQGEVVQDRVRAASQ